jgi:hypothetical protein
VCFSCRDWSSFWDDFADSWAEVSWDRRESSSVVRSANCSDEGTEVVDSLRVVSWDWSWPSSSWRELIRESFSVSEDFRSVISLSFDDTEEEYWAMSRLFFSYH